MSAKRKAKSFEERIAAHAASASVDDLAEAVGKLVSKRLHKPKAPAPKPWPSIPEPTARQRRSPRRLGRFRAYTPTSKPDISRYGTFRKYMISTIRAHSNTRDANAAHAACDNPKFAKNKLDFNWAADNGYITFD